MHPLAFIVQSSFNGKGTPEAPEAQDFFASFASGVPFPSS
jgi:hypothetical protein